MSKAATALQKEFGYSYVTWRDGDRVCEFHEWPFCIDFDWPWWQPRDIHAEFDAANSAARERGEASAAPATADIDRRQLHGKAEAGRQRHRCYRSRQHRRG